MKTSHLLFAFAALSAFVVAAPRAAEAGPNIQSSGKLGLGVALGYPHNGISFNTFLGKSMSLQIDGTIRSRHDWLGIGVRADLLFWMPQIASLGWADVAWYWGPGGNVHWFSWQGKGTPTPTSASAQSSRSGSRCSSPRSRSTSPSKAYPSSTSSDPTASISTSTSGAP